VYCPFLLITKKRYAGVYYTRPEKHDKIDKKGIEAVRRDNCQLIRDMLENVLETVLVDGNKDAAIRYIQETIRDLLMNKVDISQLVITKAISKNTDDSSKHRDEPNEDNNTKNDKKQTYKSKQAHT
jgi:DNA polymerase delta subunit 1